MYSILPFVMDHITQAWLSASFAYELIDPEEPANLDGLDASELRKDAFQIVQALVDSEPNVRSAWLKKEYSEMHTEDSMDLEAVVSLYNVMLNEPTTPPSVRDSFLRILVQDALRLSKRHSDLFYEILLPIAHDLAERPPHPVTHVDSYRNVCELVTEIWTANLRDVVKARPLAITRQSAWRNNFLHDRKDRVPTRTCYHQTTRRFA